MADIGDPPGAGITLKEQFLTLEKGLKASWAPDGERFFVMCQNAAAVRPGPWIHEVSSDRTTAISMQDYTAHGLDRVHWLPDGEHLVLASPARALHVFQVDKAGGAIAVLGYYASYALSPADGQIAYCRERLVDPPTLHESGHSGDVAIYDIATGETTTLVEGTSEFFYKPLAWPAPDLLLVSRESAQESPARSAELFSYNPQDPESKPQALEALPWHLDRDAIAGIVPPDLSEAFASNGQYPVSADLTHVAISVPTSLGDAEVWVLSADGSQAFKVAADAQRGFRPLWRPGRDQLTSGNHNERLSRLVCLID